MCAASLLPPRTELQRGWARSVLGRAIRSLVLQVSMVCCRARKHAPRTGREVCMARSGRTPARSMRRGAAALSSLLVAARVADMAVEG